MRKLRIATAFRSNAKNWRNKEISWPELVKNLSETTRTKETVAEYSRMSKPDRDRAKDVGGFVGGWVKNGRRKKENVTSRELVTLDADYVTDLKAVTDTLTAKYSGYAYFVYSTHSHTAEKPRLRIIIPLAEPVDADKYPAVARLFAKDIDINIFDDTTYEVNRLMYWPSTPSDGDFFTLCSTVEDVFLDPQVVLARYKEQGLDPLDVTTWPTSERAAQVRGKHLDKLGDPCGKPWPIGAFCKAYTIEQAIAKFLPDVYTPTDVPDRYTYSKGSTTGGLVVYDGRYAYSHHATDPINGQEVNAYDLVRIHKFGELDTDKADDTPLNKLPSQKAMLELAAGDDRVRYVLTAGFDEEDSGSVASDSPATDEKAEPWQTQLEIDSKTGKPLNTAKNYKLILRNDPALKDCLGLDMFANRRVWLKPCTAWPHNSGPVDLWSNSDDSCLRNYLSEKYRIAQAGLIDDAMQELLEANAFHPVRDYIKSCEWDGIPRAETVFIDYLGAEDNHLNRIITRKQLLAGIYRIFEPGCKYDQIMILVGPQGIGKSTMLNALGGKWFNDSLTSVQDTRTAVEQIIGSWVIEMSELQAFRKVEAEQLKQFFSKRFDKVRLAYDRRPGEFPRQCVFFGTTNNQIFLKDQTGNRRFWPCRVGVASPQFDFRDFREEQVKQVWGEVYRWYLAGEPKTLNAADEAEIRKAQEEYTVQSDYLGVITEYLAKPITDDWYSLSLEEHRDILDGGQPEKAVNKTRDRICVFEVWCEALRGDPKALSAITRNELTDAMNKISGWKKFKGVKRFGKIYGPQRGWERLK